MIIAMPKIHRLSLLLIVCQIISFNLFSQKDQNVLFPDNLEKEIIELMDTGDIPGLSVVIVKENKFQTKSFGFSSAVTKEPVTSTTLFELGSCSKAFTALAVAKLEREGKIDFDAKVSEYIPEFFVTHEEIFTPITVKQLLHHTSGVPWSMISKIPESNDSNALKMAVQKVIGEELSHKPGEEYEYSTINYDILALIIQNVTHTSFENYVMEEIVSKLDMDYTTVAVPKDSALFAKGHRISFFKAREYEAPRYKGNNAAGYFISNALDMVKWLKFQMGITHSGLSNLASLTHKRDESVSVHNKRSYAMGWEVSLEGKGEINHGGLNPNFSSYIAFRPKEEIGVVVLANSNSNFTPVIGNRIIKFLANEELVKKMDPGDQNDKVYSAISIVIGLYIVTVFAFLFWVFVDLLKKKRRFEKITFPKLGKALRTLIFILPFVFAVYLIPMALADFTWKAILVWTPGSFELMIKLSLSALFLSYIAYLIGLFFPHKNVYKRVAPQLLLLSILSGLANIITIILITSAMGTERPLGYVLFYYALTVLVFLLGKRFAQINLINISRGLVYELRVELIGRIFSTSYQKFEKIKRGRIYTALNDDVNIIGSSTNVYTGIVTNLITTIGAFFFLASIAFWATVLTILLILTITTMYYLVIKGTNPYFEQARDESTSFMGLLSGLIEGFMELSINRSKKLEFKKDMARSADRYRKKISIADIRFVNAFLVGELLLIFILGLVAFGIPTLFPGIEFYTLMSFVIVLLYLIGPINGIVGAVPALMHLKVAWNRIQVFKEAIPANINLDEVIEVVPAKINSLVAKDITFEYAPEASGQSTFSIGPINLELKSGEVLFIIGGNGSGKTTLAKLLTGLYEGSTGQFLINDKTIKASRLGEYFSTVFSPSYLFEKLYNIETDKKKSVISEYLELFHLQDKVSIENNVYSTINLSGGQRKRLALLQCYLEDSPIYLFDEWAADQDPEYRNFFYRNLLPEMKRAGKIVLAITHDDQYFDVADKVIKMNRGKVEILLGNKKLKTSELFN